MLLVLFPALWDVEARGYIYVTSCKEPMQRRRASKYKLRATPPSSEANYSLLLSHIQIRKRLLQNAFLGMRALNGHAVVTCFHMHLHIKSLGGSNIILASIMIVLLQQSSSYSYNSWHVCHLAVFYTTGMQVHGVPELEINIIIQLQCKATWTAPFNLSKSFSYNIAQLMRFILGDWVALLLM